MVSLKKVCMIFGLVVLGSFVFTSTTFAKVEANPADVSIDRTKISVKKIETKDIVVNTLNAVYSIAAVVAVIVIIAAGLMYITSDGDPGRTSTAKNAVIYAVIGLVIVGSAFIITGIVQNIASDAPQQNTTN